MRNTPKPIYYAKMVNTTPKGAKTLKYTITAQAGYYPPMEHLRGKDGYISFYLMEKLKEGSNVPSMRLQGAKSLNFTGLKDWFEDGKITGIAYGNPFDKPTYGKATKRQNPFYEYREDGYLFIVHQDKKDTTNLVPTEIELLVLEKTGEMTPRYSKQLQMGGFDEELAKLRQQAYNV